ncbi:MAG: N-acetyltransferase family protein [Verrucomicrobiota bacterium]
MKIRPCRPAEDAATIAEIYNYYIRETIISFEVDPVAADEMQTRIEEVAAEYPSYVAEKNDGKVIGYACAKKWQTRCAYKNSVEFSIYLDVEQRRRGLGTQLYEALIAESKHRGYHTAIGGVSMPNEASVRLHEKLGFKKVAHYSEVGRKFGKWIDVGYWQLML